MTCRFQPTARAIRNSQDFVFLTPATYGTGTGGGTFEGGVSGGQAFGSEIIFDGASLQVESFGDGFANEILPSVEATGEFKVLVGGIQAEYGRTTGGVQTYASKADTNSFHGGAFELFRNTDLDANTWFNNLSIGAKRQERRQRHTGGQEERIRPTAWRPSLDPEDLQRQGQNLFLL